MFRTYVKASRTAETRVETRKDSENVWVVKMTSSHLHSQLPMMVVRGRQEAEHLASKWNLAVGDCCEISNVFSGERYLKKYIAPHRT